MPDKGKLAAALAFLANQKPRNFKATATKFKVDRKTLTRRYYKETLPAAIAHVERQGHLSVAQEEALIGWINLLSERKLPPTPAMIKD